MKKQPRNLLHMPRTVEAAMSAIRGADDFLWRDLNESREKKADIMETADWLLWYGDGFTEALSCLHRAMDEVYEQKTASQPATK